MKLTVALVLFFCFQSLGDVAAQKIDLQVMNGSLKTVLQDLSKQSGYAFIYKEQFLVNAKPVTVRIQDKPIGEALAIIFKEQPFEYRIEGKVVTLKPKSPAAPAPTKSDREQQHTIHGTVIDTTGAPLPGVTVRVKATQNGTFTNSQGRYEITAVSEDAVLVFSLLGFQSQEILVADRSRVNVTLRVSLDALSQVTVVSTGYQEIPKERATGSFEQIDNALINRGVSSNIIDRLEGITSSLIFNKNYFEDDQNASPISIRGLSTIFANKRPLIIVDNFPFDGGLENINPNDVERITVLKDAAASSIWGARSSNGVIVITTKKGNIGKALKVSFNSNYTYTEKPNIYYKPNFIPASAFIDMEEYLFQKGYYDFRINSLNRPVISPVIEVLAQQEAGLLTEAQARQQINALRNNDIRRDISRHLYRSAGTQQYAINLSGGTNQLSYYFSAGYDDATENIIGNTYNRLTLNSASSLSLIKNLKATVGLRYALTENENNGDEILSQIDGYYPYAKLADKKGTTLALPKDYRLSYLDNLAGSGLLDWHYNPLDELSIAEKTSKGMYARFNTSLSYSFFPELSAEVSYQLEKQQLSSQNHNTTESYFTRNLINIYTQETGDELTRVIPLGGILDQSSSEMTGQSLRAQINYNNTIADKHMIHAIAGIDGKELTTDQMAWRLYGYSDLTGVSSGVDYNSTFPQFENLSFAKKIPYFNRSDKYADIFFSYYANASYTYLNRYVVSASARIDQSNLFGVNTNQKSVPLWSIGTSWELSQEKFWSMDWLPYLRLRATYGYNGNIDKSVSAYTTANFLGTSFLTNAPYVIIENPPNPELRWERISLFNVGVDFKLADNVFSGSIEYYRRSGSDMIGFAPIDPTTGVQQFKGNVTDIQGSGIDIDVGIRTGKTFQWNSFLLLSLAKNKVTSYQNESSLSAYLQGTDGSIGLITPIEGHPVFSIASFPWAGLDPETGDPMGYLDGEISKDYGSIASSDNLQDAIFHGSATPELFGAFRNEFCYKAFSLSVNISYKMGYYFRRTSVNYQDLAATWKGHQDFSKRWQNPGDEANTTVPSLVYPIDYSRERFYQYSEVLVERGDHVRLQDIRLSYRISATSRVVPLENIELYAYARNLGIIWKATSADIDPDYVRNYTFVSPLSFSLGVRATF